MNIIGPNIRKIREALGLTQEELAARCNLLEWDISRGTIAKIESQVRRITDSEVLLFSKALNVTPTDLFIE